MGLCGVGISEVEEAIVSKVGLEDTLAERTLERLPVIKFYQDIGQSIGYSHKAIFVKYGRSIMANTVLALFSDAADADRAVRELEQAGYSLETMSVITKEGTYNGEGDDTAGEAAGNAVEGAVGGATTGGVIGGLAGLLAGAGVVPALAGLFIGGPIAAALGLTGVAATAVSGAVTGAAAGGLIGALTGLGLTQSEAERYEQVVNEGGTVIAVPVADEHDQAFDILERHNADNVKAVTVTQ